MITVHHLNNSRSQRVLWLLEELGLDYEIKKYQRDPKTMLAPKSLREIHPLGKSPVIEDGDIRVAESGAIMEYLLDTYDDGTLGAAPGTQEHRDIIYWLHYAEGSAMSPLLLQLVFSELPRQGPILAKPIMKAVSNAVKSAYVNPQVKLHMDYWESSLEGRSYFVGDTLSVADIQMSFPLEAVMARSPSDRYPNIARFVENIHKRDAYQRALSRGGTYDYA